jgi:hypothetical protein
VKLIAIALLLCSSLGAWHRNGHMLVAWLAYQHLSPAARSRVDAALQTHPDYRKWIADLPSEGDRGVEAFLQASVWPDTIKNDPRFYNDTRADAKETPPLPGIPDTAMHQNWHYIDYAIETHGSKSFPIEEPNAVSAISAVIVDLSNPYNLSWMIHLTGDLHQPLHSVSRFSGHHHGQNGSVDIGDQGGNLFLIDDPSHNLHSLWDGVFDNVGSRADLIAIGKTLAPPADLAVRLDTQAWISESVQLAKSVVYPLGDDVDGEAPPKPSAKYRQKMMDVSKLQIALAGYRLAAILNDRLQ